MKQLNHCSARYGMNTLISYATLIYKRTEHYTFVYRYHSATTTQHWYKFCAKIGIDYPAAHQMWNYKSGTHGVVAIPNNRGEPTRYFHNGQDMSNARERFTYPDEVPVMGYGIVDLY